MGFSVGGMLALATANQLVKPIMKGNAKIEKFDANRNVTKPCRLRGSVVRMYLVRLMRFIYVYMI